jgi:hypothetical protein
MILPNGGFTALGCLVFCAFCLFCLAGPLRVCWANSRLDPNNAATTKISVFLSIFLLLSKNLYIRTHFQTVPSQIQTKRERLLLRFCKKIREIVLKEVHLVRQRRMRVKK